LTTLIAGVDDPGAKSFFDGTHRAVAPEETLERIGPLMRGMGITRLANITGLDRIGIPVATACRPNSRGLAVSQGKGLDLPTAKASALMESVESYHAERIELPLRLGSSTELSRSLRLCDVTKLALTLRSTFDPNRPLLWIEGYDLLQQQPAWVPYEIVDTNYTFPLVTGAGCFQATTNGLASGNHVLEAVSHALCEVIERDAVALWYAGSESARRTRRIDVSTIDSQPAIDVLTRLERHGFDVGVWNLTTDVGVPSVLATIVERPGFSARPPYAVHGSGCHPTRDVALIRALLEALQSRLTFIVGSRDDNYREDYERLFNSKTTRAVRAEIGEAPPTVNFVDLPNFQSETFEDDVRHEIRSLQQAGIEQSIVIDLTRADLGIPVVRVVVPGLEGVSTQPDYVAGARARASMGAGSS
jgi:ribosomal protein S12 methylthiotransferase accessory factor